MLKLYRLKAFIWKGSIYEQKDENFIVMYDRRRHCSRCSWEQNIHSSK